MTDYFLTIGTIICLNIIVAMGLDIIWGYAGQPHLGITIYTSIGAYGASILLKLGWSFLPVMFICIILAFAFGIITGLPSLRVGEDFLAILTIGLVFLVESFYTYLPQSWFGGPLGLLNIPGASLFGHQFDTTQFFFLTLFFAVVLVFLKISIIKSWLGLFWESIRDDEVAARVMGANTAMFKIIAFGVGAGYCGLAGFLYAQFMGSVSPVDFGFIPSLFIATMVMLGGVGTIAGPIAGAIILSILPEAFRFVQEYRNLIFGSLLVVVMLYQPSGLFGKKSFLRLSLFALSQKIYRKAASEEPAPSETPVEEMEPKKGVSLVVEGVTVRFGGLKALDGVTLSVNSGRINGIVGPNGAGKTTLFNVISGIYQPDEGGIFLNGLNLCKMKPYEIARSGVGRTFQVVRPFQTLSVLQNVLIPHIAKVYSSPFRLFQKYNNIASFNFGIRILSYLGLERFCNELAQTLPLGLLRRLEIARCLSLSADVILLDESFSGLSAEESKTLKELILALKGQGKGILLIEHNMEIAQELCDRLVVLNFGQKIAEGTPGEVCANPLVVEAYIGKEE